MGVLEGLIQSLKPCLLLLSYKLSLWPQCAVLNGGLILIPVLRRMQFASFVAGISGHQWMYTIICIEILVWNLLVFAPLLYLSLWRPNLAATRGLSRGRFIICDIPMGWNCSGDWHSGTVCCIAHSCCFSAKPRDSSAIGCLGVGGRGGRNKESDPFSSAVLCPEMKKAIILLCVGVKGRPAAVSSELARWLAVA